VLPVYKPVSNSPAKKSFPEQMGEKITFSPRKSILESPPNKSNNDDNHLHSKISFLERQLEELKLQAQQTRSKEHSKESPSPPPPPSVSHPTTDKILTTILDKLESFENRLKFQESATSTHLNHSSASASSPNSSMNNSKNSNNISSESVVEVQENLEKFTSLVDQALQARNRLKESLQTNHIIPEKKLEVSHTEKELSQVLESFVNIINQCSTAKTRSNELLSLFEGENNGELSSSSPYLGDRKYYDDAGAFRNSSHSRSSSPRARSASPGPNVNGSPVYTFSKTPRYTVYTILYYTVFYLVFYFAHRSNDLCYLNYYPQI
jgi:hypothetical protein